MNTKQTGLIVCGTDTNVGKTVVSALIVQGLNAIYWKPIQSGLEEGGDTGRVCALLKLARNRWLPEAYKFRSPVSPHWAAEKENAHVEQSRLRLPLVEGPLIVETAGGLMVPLNRKLLQIDQIKQWSLPVVIVARTELGTLNHTLLSIEALRHRQIPILGLLLNGPDHSDNPKTLKQIGNIPLIGHLPRLERLSADTLANQWQSQNLGPIFKQLMHSTNG